MHILNQKEPALELIFIHCDKRKENRIISKKKRKKQAQAQAISFAT
jgi:hypothetical protein